jgi:hypothetical protein
MLSDAQWFVTIVGTGLAFLLFGLSLRWKRGFLGTLLPVIALFLLGMTCSLILRLDAESLYISFLRGSAPIRQEFSQAWPYLIIIALLIVVIVISNLRHRGVPMSALDAEIVSEVPRSDE